MVFLTFGCLDVRGFSGGASVENCENHQDEWKMCIHDDLACKTVSL